MNGQVRFMYHNITPILGNEILKHHYRFHLQRLTNFLCIPQPYITVASNACILFFDSAVSHMKKSLQTNDLVRKQDLTGLKALNKDYHFRRLRHSFTPYFIFSALSLTIGIQPRPRY